MRWTACCARRTRASRTAKSCGPDASTLASSLRIQNSQATVTNKPGRRGERAISRKPLRGECRVFFGVTVVTNARAFYTTRAAAGASSTRHSPRPLFGGKEFAKPGRVVPRDRGRVCFFDVSRPASELARLGPHQGRVSEGTTSPLLTIFWHCGGLLFSFRTVGKACSWQPTVNGFGRESGFQRVWQC